MSTQYYLHKQTRFGVQASLHIMKYSRTCRSGTIAPLLQHTDVSEHLRCYAQQTAVCRVLGLKRDLCRDAAASCMCCSVLRAIQRLLVQSIYQDLKVALTLLRVELAAAIKAQAL